MLLLDAELARQRTRAYYTLSPVRSATSLDVVLTPNEKCGAGLPASRAVLAELELYSTVDPFDNELAGAAPRGFSTTSMATLYAGDAKVAALPPTDAAASLTGVTFASSGTGSTGDDARIDDVLFEQR